MEFREERQLLHSWMTYLSPLMMPVPNQVNPYQTVIVPLALMAMDKNRGSAGTLTLRYSLYALAAISRENLRQEKQHGPLAAKYLHLSFRFLRLSLSETNVDFP